MKTKLFTVLWPALLLNGCMVAGMGGMGGMGHMMPGGTHGEDPPTAVSGQHIVKEVVAHGIRVTADFPPFAPSDSLTYTVTLRDLGGRAITADASVFLSVSPAALTSDAMPPAPGHAGHPATTEGARRSDLALTRVVPVLRGGGTFVFRPSVPRDGPYRLTVLVERVGDTVMEPPLALDQVVQLSAHIESPTGHGQALGREGLTPLLLLGAGLMAVMMIFSFR